MDPRLSKELKELKQQCRVCDEKAAGFHFGAFTCEGCKSFFGRCSDEGKGARLPQCKTGGECPVTGRNRTACKRCRWEKCLSVGMARSNSRYGRRSHYFKVSCLEEQQKEKLKRDGIYPNDRDGPYPIIRTRKDALYPTVKELDLLVAQQNPHVPPDNNSIRATHSRQQFQLKQMYRSQIGAAQIHKPSGFEPIQTVQNSSGVPIYKPLAIIPTPPPQVSVPIGAAAAAAGLSSLLATYQSAFEAQITAAAQNSAAQNISVSQNSAIKKSPQQQPISNLFPLQVQGPSAKLSADKNFGGFPSQFQLQPGNQPILGPGLGGIGNFGAGYLGAAAGLAGLPRSILSNWGLLTPPSPIQSDQSPPSSNQSGLTSLTYGGRTEARTPTQIRAETTGLHQGCLHQRLTNKASITSVTLATGSESSIRSNTTLSPAYSNESAFEIHPDEKHTNLKSHTMPANSNMDTTTSRDDYKATPSLSFFIGRKGTTIGLDVPNSSPRCQYTSVIHGPVKTERTKAGNEKRSELKLEQMEPLDLSVKKAEKTEKAEPLDLSRM